MPLATNKPKTVLSSDRSRIDLSDEAIARQWTKKLGRPRAEIEAAIAKVGDNCETVRKELRVVGPDSALPKVKSSA
jgi:hypothetical protein